MGIFRQFPYSNFHEMNMDEIIKIVRELADEWLAYQTKWAKLYKDVNEAFEDFTTEFNTFLASCDAQFQAYMSRINVEAVVRTVITDMLTDGSLATIITTPISEATTAWLNTHITQPTDPVIDSSLSVAGAGADAYETGSRIEMLTFNTEQPDIVEVANILQGHYWSSTDGSLATSPNFMCSPNLIPVEPGLYVSDISQNCLVTMFGKNREYLGDQVTIRPANSNNSIFQLLNKNTRFIGISTPTNSAISSIKLRRIKGVDVLQAPFANGGDYIYINNGIYTTDGVFQSSDAFFTILMPAKGNEKYVTNARYGQNFCCWDSDNNVLGSAPFVDNEYFTRVITTPANTAKIAFNFQKVHVHGTTTDFSTVVYKLTQNTKILAIGDSITWLNNHQGYNGSNRFWGWQKTVERAGYEVTTMGYSGFPVANDDEHDSIYNQVVTDQMDVSGYDIVILFAGTNDNLFDIPIGNEINTYYQTAFDDHTFSGAYAGILRYIRDNNAAAKIIVCTSLKSEAGVRNYPRALPYVNTIRHLAEVYSCYVCDLFETMNVSPNTIGFERYFYDSTHPNRYGMERVGKQILEAIENC